MDLSYFPYPSTRLLDWIGLPPARDGTKYIETIKMPISGNRIVVANIWACSLLWSFG